MTASSHDEIRSHILLVEDQVLIRFSFTTMLESGGFKVTPVASAEEALEVLEAGLDIRGVVTDVALSPFGMSGFELARRVHTNHQLGIVVVSGYATPEAGELPLGARFLAKPVHKATFVRVVQDVVGSAPSRLSIGGDAASQPRAPWTLTPRQHEVLALLVQGKSNRDIAEAMGLSENTVRVHIMAIYRELGVSSRTEALLAGQKRLALGQHSTV